MEQPSRNQPDGRRSINTVVKLLVEVAEAAYTFHDKAVRDVQCKRVQSMESGAS
jgi:hypothetical protein